MKNNTSIPLFWNWITYNEKTLRNLQNEKPKIQKLFIYWLEKHLHYYCSGLDALLIFPEQKKQPTQLIISANGNPDFFNQVNALITDAPTLPHWKFIAFIQPSKNFDELEAGLDKPYVFKDIILKTSELKFMPFEYDNEKKIDMIVYLKDFTVHCKNKNLLQVIFIMMQDLLGEKVLYERINFVELAQMPEEEDNELIQLYELQFYLDEINLQKTKF